MSNRVIHYLAYGSNLHPVRLTERVASANLLGRVELPGYRLTFRKRGGDGSGKCDLMATNNSHDIVYGGLYQFDFSDKSVLDRYEGLGNGYTDESVSVSLGSKKYNCLTYLAQSEYIDDTLKPFHWYKQLVIRGARYLDFPENYLSIVKKQVSLPDQNVNRQELHTALLSRMQSGV